MTNSEFIDTLKKSFLSYLEVGTSRSTAKLKSLHGDIANDIAYHLGNEYLVKSQGILDSREGVIRGRYYSKNVDITIYKDKSPIAGYAIKFVVRNYSQNSNNYFENMLGETANIRSNQIPYFQILILFDKTPYYKKGGEFGRWDIISNHNLDKYLIMSQDSPKSYFHTPDKTLIVLLHLLERIPDRFTDESDYAEYYLSRRHDKDMLTYSNLFIEDFKNTGTKNTIYNDYETFISKSCHIIKGI